MSGRNFSGIYAKLELDRGFETIGKAWEKADKSCSWAVTHSQAPCPSLNLCSSPSQAAGIGTGSPISCKTQAGFRLWAVIHWAIEQTGLRLAVLGYLSRSKWPDSLSDWICHLGFSDQPHKTGRGSVCISMPLPGGFSPRPAFLLWLRDLQQLPMA